MQTAEPHARRWTREEFYRMGGAGLFNGQRAELIDGEIRQVEVYRDPAPDPSQPYGHGYTSTTALVPPAAVSPLAAPGVSLPVADLLP